MKTERHYTLKKFPIMEIRYDTSDTYYIEKIHDKYFKVMQTLFLFELGDDIEEVLTEYTDRVSSVIYMPIDYDDTYADRIKKLFEYIIFKNQAYVNNIGIICHTDDILLDTRKMIEATSRIITKTKQRFPTERSVAFHQSIEMFKGSMGESNNGINTSVFIRSSQSADKYLSIFPEIFEGDSTVDYTLSFEFRDNKILGSMSTGVILGNYRISASKIHRVPRILKETTRDDK